MPSGGHPIAGSRLPQLPDLRGAQLVDGLVDQVGALVVVGRVEVGIDLVDQLRVAHLRGDPIADAVAVADGGIGVREVVARPHMHIDEVGHHVGIGRWGPRNDREQAHEQRGSERLHGGRPYACGADCADCGRKRRRATYAKAMRLMAAVALGCGCMAAPMVSAASVSASPGTCDGAACVTYIERGAAAGDSCVQNTRYNVALDASGATLACSANRVWIASPPLVGIRTVRSQCGESKGVAMSPDGVTLSCIGGGRRADYTLPLPERGGGRETFPGGGGFVPPP